MKIDKNKSAIVLIEIQKQWTEKGFYNSLIKAQLESGQVLENTYTLVNEARENGFKIIHAPLIIDPENKKGWFAYLTFGRVFTKGSWKSEITNGFCRKDDLIVEGRYSFDAFTGSNLEQMLKENHIENLYFCGFTTDHCIAKTMKTALGKKFNSYLVSDCTAARSNSIQRKVEKRFNGRVVKHNEILEMVS